MDSLKLSYNFFLSAPIPAHFELSMITYGYKHESKSSLLYSFHTGFPRVHGFYGFFVNNFLAFLYLATSWLGFHLFKSLFNTSFHVYLGTTITLDLATFNQPGTLFNLF